MSEKQLKTSPRSNAAVFRFIIILSIVCALILSTLASALKQPKEIARELDRSKEMLIAAKVLDHQGHFLLEDGQIAKYLGKGALGPGDPSDLATQNQILSVVKRRLIPKLVDSRGKVTTFKEAGIDKDTYIAEYKKTGYYKQPLKLFYEILPNPKEGQSPEKTPIGYIIPVNGFGLWDAIYGYLALKPDGITVIGISWYEQKETPGLGANIAEAEWQSLFPGKLIVQPSPDGEVNVKTAPIGITVVKGKVVETIGDLPKARAAVDGMAGATLTGNGVTEAYKDVLSAYRPFFIELNKESS